MAEFLSQDEVDDLLQWVTGEWNSYCITVASSSSFDIDQEVFLIIKKGLDLSVQKVQITYIWDDSIATTYKEGGKILGVYLTREEANEELTNNWEKILEQVRQDLVRILDSRQPTTEQSAYATVDRIIVLLRANLEKSVKKIQEESSSGKSKDEKTLIAQRVEEKVGIQGTVDELRQWDIVPSPKQN